MYSKDHEWVLVEGATAKIGITDFAQHEIGDIVFVEVPAQGDSIAPGASFSVIESVKATSDVYAPVGGTVCWVNAALADKPELLNEAPYDNPIAAVSAVAFDLSGLMDAEAYEALVKSEG